MMKAISVRNFLQTISEFNGMCQNGRLVRVFRGMKMVWVMVCVMCTASAATGAADELTFVCNDGGVFVVSNGQTNLVQQARFRVIRPNWSGDYDSEISTKVTRSADGACRIEGAVGKASSYQIDVTKVKDAIEARCQMTLAAATPIETAYVSMFIPISFSQAGGTFRTSNHTNVKFPPALKAKFIFAGVVTWIAWDDGRGRGMRISFPSPTYVSLQDNRAFEWPIFDLQIRVAAAGGVGSQTLSMTMKAEDAKGKPRAQVDRFGQCVAKNWAGKVTSDDQLRGDIADEAAYNKMLGGWPAEWDEYGGLKGTQQKYNLKSTGFFYTQKIDGRWWLVDPLGNVFFAVACSYTECDTATVIEGRSDLFEWLPTASDPQWKNFIFQEGGKQCTSFYSINLQRKYGNRADAGAAIAARARERWVAWGLNTTSAFGGSLPKMPSTPWLAYPIWRGAAPIPGAGVHDIFEPTFEANLDAACAVELKSMKDDPYIIGYWLGNEETFEEVAVATPMAPASCAAKVRLVKFLQERYADIGAFNAAWAMSAADFESLKALSFQALTDAARKDMDAFLALFCDTYGRLVREAIRKYDPNHLLIGYRWTPKTASNETVVRELGKHLDVVSVNYYTASAPAATTIEQWSMWAGDKPIFLSEWSYGTTERGHVGGVRDVGGGQKGRAQYYRRYVEAAAKTSSVVGTHWFEYTDMAITGRMFGDPASAERFSTGFIDVADRPYREFINEIIKTNYRIYDVAMKKSISTNAAEASVSVSADEDKPASIVRRPVEVAIDGRLDEWQSVPEAVTLTSENLVVGSAERAAELMAKVWLAWDEVNLYVAVRVEDSAPMTNGWSGEEMWKGDAIELFINNRAKGASVTLDADDHQIGIQPGCSSAKVAASMWDWKKRCAVAGGVVQGVLRTANPAGYTIEAQIPLSAIGIVSPKAGLVVDFNVGLDDNVAVGSLRDVQLMWKPAEGASYSRAGWGQAVFAP